MSAHEAVEPAAAGPIDDQESWFSYSDEDPFELAVAKAEIRGAVTAFAAMDELISACAQMAMEHDLHDDLLSGLIALSEDLRLHVRDKIVPLKGRLG